MKLAILSSKMRLKKPKGNIHFGKVFLALVMMLTMIFGSFEKAEASEPLYYYDRYSTKLGYEFVTTGDSFERSLHYHGEWTGDHSSSKSYGLVRYGFTPLSRDEIENPKNLSEEGIKNLPINSFFQSGNRNSSGSSFDKEIYKNLGWIKDERESYSSYDGYTVNYNGIFKVQKAETKSIRIKDKLTEENIIGNINEYPRDGIHTDGNWYIRRGLANNNPTLTLSSLGENSYFV